MSFMKLNNLLIGNSYRIMLTSVSFSDVSTRKHIATYVDTDGEYWSDLTFSPRTITINGTFFADSFEDSKKIRRQIISNCNPVESQKMVYDDGNRTYYANVYADIPTFAKISNRAEKFSIVCNIPDFWLRGEEINKGLYQIHDNIYGEFSLPRAFSILESGARFEIDGDAPIIPRFIISSDVDTEVPSISITNVSSGEHITLEDYNFSAGEIVTIDCEAWTDTNRVISSVNGNIIRYVAPNSTFFQIQNGDRVECLTSGLTVTCSYRERYRGV